MNGGRQGGIDEGRYAYKMLSDGTLIGLEWWMDGWMDDKYWGQQKAVNLTFQRKCIPYYRPGARSRRHLPKS
jgi:hypothetical protein